MAGIGPKTAIGLISKYKSKGNIYKHLPDISPNVRTKLEQGKDGADLSYELATIVTNVPIDFDFKKMGDWDLGSTDAIKLFLDYGFKTLTNRIMNGNKSGESASAQGYGETKKDLTRQEVEYIVLAIAKKLKDRKYAIRGTASMVLQGLEMGVDDIDLIADKETSLLMNELFKKEMVEEVKYSESDKFKSYFGKFVIDNVQVEVMGEWQIRKTPNIQNSKIPIWGEVYDGSEDDVYEIEINGVKIKVTKPETELKMFAQMQRWTAYQKIKKQLSEKQQGSLF